MISESMTQNAMKNLSKENLWIGTPLESYCLLDPKSKGCFGEELVKTVVHENYALPVSKRTSPGHDAIIGGYPTEIKFSAATKRNYDYKFTFNHIGVEKDWDRIIFMGVNGDMNEKMRWFTKKDILSMIENSSCLAHQQGGKDSANDDYISANKNSQELLNHPLAKTMEQW